MLFQLVKKDFIIHKNVLVVMFAALMAYMVVDVPIIFLGLIFSWTMTMQIFSSDEKRQAKMLLSSLPFTRKEIVSSKYISAILYVLLVVVTMSAGSLVIHQELLNLLHLAFVVIVSLFLVALMYPFSYKFASKYLLIAFFVGFAFYFLTVKLFVPNLNDQILNAFAKIAAGGEPIYLLYAMIILVIVYSTSWLLSIKIYEKKVF